MKLYTREDNNCHRLEVGSLRLEVGGRRGYAWRQGTDRYVRVPRRDCRWFPSAPTFASISFGGRRHYLYRESFFIAWHYRLVKWLDPQVWRIVLSEKRNLT